ncbi:MAG: sigma-54 dependent transcriptional regulator, partial [Planctomycetota bacterium]
SPRSDKPFVSENCAAITETLLESELFGYVKGAFTGANKDHKGLFEIADGGTLFLDEVGDMSSSMQKKLLRVLQEGVIRRVGAKEYTPVDVRIISATNKDLLSECRKGNFREDLYYRLNVINLKLPPLRDRKEDVVPLIEFFLEQSAKEHGTHTSVDPNAQQKLVAYAWPGNVRELQNEVKRLCAMADDQIIKVSDLSEALLSGEAGESTLQDWPVELAQMTLREATERLEKSMIQNALNETGGNKSLVAKTLQIPKTSLYNKINKYELT